MPARILTGAPVAESLCAQLNKRLLSLRERGIVPCLAVVRIGSQIGSLSYERSIEKRCDSLGLKLTKRVFDDAVSQDELISFIESLGKDPSVHGIVLFRPLPEAMDTRSILNSIPFEKDVDGVSSFSMAAVYSGDGSGFPPCTAEAVLEMLRYYEIPVSGKKAVVVGRSLVTGRPAAMLLLREHATVTICHTRTADLAEAVSTADLVVTATGHINTLTEKHLHEGQIVIDIGINYDETRKRLCGDVDHEAAESVVSCISAVPGGIGSVTTAILCKHVIEAAERTAG